MSLEGARMNNCYVLFVRTGCEEEIVHKLESRLDSSLFLPFVTTKGKYFRRNGKTTKVTELFFSRYIFIKSELFSDDYIVEISAVVRIFNNSTFPPVKMGVTLDKSSKITLKIGVLTICTEF